jgi:hypothetical protein
MQGRDLRAIQIKSNLAGYSMDEKNVAVEPQQDAATEVEMIELSLEQLANVGGGGGTPSLS